MALTVRRGMAKGRGGRPRKEDGDSSTRQVRVFADLADMMAEIIDVEGGTVANLVDGWIREKVVAKHTVLKPLIEQMKQTRLQAQSVKEE